MPAGEQTPKPREKGKFMPVEVGRAGMPFVFVTVPVLPASLYRKGLSACIAGGMMPVWVKVLVVMGVSVPSVPMNVHMLMLMPMGVLVAVFHL